MKNLKKVVFVSFFLLVVLIVAYLLVNLIPSKKSEEEVYISVFIDKIDKIKVKKGEDEFFVSLKDGVSDIDKKVLNKHQIEYLFGFFEKVVASHIFEPKEKLEEYGFENPTAVFEVYGKNGDSIDNLKIGNKTSDGEGYYVMSDGARRDIGKICVVNVGRIEPILIDRKGYIDLKLIKPYEKTFGDDKKYNGDGVQKCKINKKGVENSLEVVADEESGELVVKSPKDFKLDDKNKKMLDDAPKLLIAKEVLNLNPSDEELKKYGLKEPLMTVFYSIDDVKYKIHIGNVYKVEQIPSYEEEKEEIETIKNYYVKIDEFKPVFVVSENELPWLNIKF